MPTTREAGNGARLRDKLSVLKAKSKRTQARIKAVNTEYDENLHTARARSRGVLVYCQLLFSWQVQQLYSYKMLQV